jgi:hypothetical protein
VAEQQEELDELRKRVEIAEMSVRVRDGIIDRLPKTLDGTPMTAGMRVYVPFKGVMISRSGFRADGYREDTVATIEWVRGKPSYTLECEGYAGYNVPCYSSAEACLWANPSNRKDSERFLELALANAREARQQREIESGVQRG